MRTVSDKLKVIYLLILIIFISAFGVFWMDYIGLIHMEKYIKKYTTEAPGVVDAPGDEPSLVEREEFEKEKQKLQERVEDLDKRETLITERERELKAENEKLEEMKRGLELEKKKFQDQKNEYAGYEKNVRELAGKIASMPPEESVKIMINWEEPLIIDVLRRMDADAEEAGRSSITSYLITLMPKEKASRIMYLMTQI